MPEGKKYPIPENRKQVYDYYKLTFDKEGCPMKQVGGSLVFHPLYPAYLIVNYTALAGRAGGDNYQQYAEEIAKISWKHSSTLKNASVFYYEPSAGLSRIRTRFYSALTQARWIHALCELKKLRPGYYDSKIRRLYNSLLISVRDGGVLKKSAEGWSVEEYPLGKGRPAGRTLNGWITVLNCLIKSKKGLKEIGVNIDTFLNKNFDAMEKMLPLYDVPRINNSRYQLTGATKIILSAAEPIGIKCNSFDIVIPREGRMKGCFESGDNWRNYLLEQEADKLTFNVLLSLAPFPEPNIFNAKIYANKSAQLKISVGKGEWRPEGAALSVKRYEQIGTESLKKGWNKICVKIPYDALNLFAYPTNFNKKIDGRKGHNVYHFIHAEGLAALYAYSERPIFKKYCKLWLSYISKWKSMPILKNNNINHYTHGESFPEKVLEILNK